MVLILPDLAVETHASRRRTLESSETAQQSGLTRAGTPEQRCNPTGRQFASDVELKAPPRQADFNCQAHAMTTASRMRRLAAYTIRSSAKQPASKVTDRRCAAP